MVQLILLLIGISAVISEARKREYFVAIEEIEWDYAPMTLEYVAPFYVTQGPDRIGHKYKKAVYREYTDDSFLVQTYRPSSLGLYGPILRAEAKDTLIVHAVNRASRGYSMHPHGVFYLKSSEGALYNDNTTYHDKADDAIPPGGTHTYIWEVRDEYAPGPDDPNCLTWAYHSHVDSTRDQNSGLIGTLLTCKPGVLTPEGFRTDIDREFAMIVTNIDENESWYIDENIQTYALEPASVDKNDEGFQQSNIMMGVNGRTGMNLPGVEMCKGDLVNWYLIGMGTTVHVMQFVANTITVNSHRQDTVTLLPATFVTAEMRADNPGQWFFGCHVTDHAPGGMAIFYTISNNCQPSLGGRTGMGMESLDGMVKTYYVAAEEVDWNYAPTGVNAATRRPIADPGQLSTLYFEKAPNRIGGTYKKAVYREYTDGSFTTKAERDTALGILGPVIAGEVGDTIKVVFKNKANRTFMAEPHGVFIFNRDAVEPGETLTYIWAIPKSVAPTAKDDDCLTYLYTSMANLVTDQYSGLVGPLLICKKGTLEKTLKRKTYYMLLNTFDENSSPFFEENINEYIEDPDSLNREDGAFIESNLMRSINGLAFGSLMGVETCAGEETDFRVISIGSEIDNHAFIVEGVRAMKHRQEMVGGVEVYPHTTATVTVVSAEPGANMIGCLVSNHFRGMFAMYQSKACGLVEKWVPRATRTYYVAAVEEMWDFFPERVDIHGDSVDNPNHNYYLRFRKGDGKFLGTTYKTAIFHEYTDANFTERKSKPEHLGFIGPIIKAEVGDLVKVVFKNMASRPYSVNPEGIFTAGMMNGPILPVQPGETRTYEWQIREELEPGPKEPDCVATMYTSFATPIVDAYSGLNGPILICRKGTLHLGKGGGADQEFFLFFNIFNENLSPYLDDNIRELLNVDPETFDKTDGEFIESNIMDHINGRLYHLPGLNMKKGDLVRWHLIAVGEEDIHTVHFHANAFVHESDTEQRGDVFDLMNGRVATVTMHPDAVGRWLMHCHVNTHVQAGMVTTYTVSESEVVCKTKCDWYSCDNDIRADCSLLGIGASRDLLNARGELRLKNNRTTSFVPAERIVHLDLSHNPGLGDVSVLRSILSRFPALETVVMNNINLTELSHDLFVNNPRIVSVHAENNRIRTVSSKLVSTHPTLKFIDLRRNDLRTVPYDVTVGGSRGLRRLDLRGNAKLVPKCLNALHVNRLKTTMCVNGIMAVLKEVESDVKA